MLSRNKLLRKARSSRRLHITIVDNDEVIPPMPTSPIEEAIQSRRSGAATVDAIPMPLPPTTSNQCSLHFHHRQISSGSTSHVSQFSRASSSWSSSASSTSSSCSSSSTIATSRGNPAAHLAWDPLRLHPSTMFDCAPSDDADSYCYDGGDVHDFDFGFGVPRYHAARQMITPVSSTAYDDTSFVQGLSAPPRHHRRAAAAAAGNGLRTHQSEASLSLMAASRPTTPDLDIFSSSASEPSSPIRPRMQPVEATETEHMLKRGDWKRRGIIFGLEN